MNTKHTPGPWFVWAPRPERWPCHTIRASDEQYVAEVVIHAHNPASADAALIAAAPELLEALKAVREIVAFDAQRLVDSVGDGPEADNRLSAATALIEQVDDAIAKAEGR